MGSEKMLLWSVCLVIMLFVSVALVDYFVLLHNRAEFDRICQQYYWMCDQNVGLTEAEVLSFHDALVEKGFDNIQIQVPNKGSVSRGHLFEFVISSQREVNWRQQLFSSNKAFVPFIYKRESISRQVVN